MAGNKRKPERFLYFTEDDYKKFIKAAYKHGEIHAVLWELIGATGLRISEAIHLCVEDFDFESNILRVRTLKQKKEDQPVDFLEVSPRILQKVKKYILFYVCGCPNVNRLSPEGEKRILKKCSSERLFPYTRQWAFRHFKAICRLAKISTRFSPHAMRHFHGLMVAKITNGDRIAIQKRLRHRSGRSIDFYVHLLQEVEKKITEYYNDNLALDT